MTREFWPLESGLRVEAILDTGGNVAGVKVIGNTEFACRFLERLGGSGWFACAPGAIILKAGRQRAKVPIPPVGELLSTDIAIAMEEGGRVRGIDYSFNGHTEGAITLGRPPE